MVKIAIVGKGGVGKTTVAAVLARLIGRRGYSVIAIDADPSLNLAQALGIPREAADATPALFDEEKFIRSRTLLPGGAYRLNPKVDDIVERFGIKGPDNVILLKLGEVKKGGTRCLCPEYALLRALLSHLVLSRKEVVVLDMVAGLEPMSRGTARGVDHMLCIIEPNLKAIDVAIQIMKLAGDIEVGRFFIAVNKVRSNEDVEYVKRIVGGDKIAAVIPYDESVIEADKRGLSVLDYHPEAPIVTAVGNLVKVFIT
ncbi:MAG: AAA family ATPase [Ignisphaera sp.]|nr:AAA family ATPase [Ignisphaera sp.]MCX8168300.1 AAA family ATPase [Ignisphaera sp.]MDW8085880.1 AAA family ATPase [Ignisphaera sp.]